MDTQATVLLVEDNNELNEINRRALKNARYRVLAALTLAQAREHLAACGPDVILLDIVLPDGDGIDFCGEIRGDTDAHILFLTSKTDHVDRIRGLTTGGDDYITKPYKLDEMLARVGAAVRRRKDMTSLKTIVTCGPLTLDVVAGRAFVEGLDLSLTQKEFALLLMLVQSEGKTLSKEVLYEGVWRQPLAGDGGALWKHLSTLKKKLGDTAALHTERGGGYLLKILK